MSSRKNNGPPWGCWIALALLCGGASIVNMALGGEVPNHAPFQLPPAMRTPVAPEISYSPLRTRIFDAGTVFGRAGCGDYALAERVARHASRQGLPVKVLAALVAVESHCKPLAVSTKGAIGLTQVRVSTWKGEYDFARVNLLEPETSVRVGAEILARNVKRHGLHEGIVRYNGQGPDAERYAQRVLALAGY